MYYLKNFKDIIESKKARNKKKVKDKNEKKIISKSMIFASKSRMVKNIFIYDCLVFYKGNIFKY